ncbi:hypothetical protein N566_03660 [Streptomycetaceae bacterium MP113-05]|nr:hypothetical protein N566_03660 [Streptomycetaceae bacterium MP113-05]
MLGQLVRVARDQETTVILITHEPRVAGYADREIVLRDGEVDFTGLGVTGFDAVATRLAAGNRGAA